MKRRRFVWAVELPARDSKDFIPVHVFVRRSDAVDAWGDYYPEDKARVRRYVRPK